MSTTLTALLKSKTRPKREEVARYKTWKRAFVDGYGPFDALLLVVGEAPGKQEELGDRHGPPRPFIGATGRRMRGFLSGAGLDPDRVRWDNAIPYNIFMPAQAGARAALLRQYEAHLDTSLTRTRCRVVLACGGVSLQRLLGMTNISEEHGGVVRVRRGVLLSREASRGTAQEILDEQVLVVPCLHPAGVMQTKLQAEMLSVQRVVERAVRLSAKPVEMYQERERKYVVNPSDDLVADVLGCARVVAFDTEFDKDNYPFMVGFRTDSYDEVVVLSGEESIQRNLDALRYVVERPEGPLKVAHHAPAEVESFIALGMRPTTRGWFDTLQAFSTLYPDMPMNLSYMSRFYLDGVRNWKGMAHDDPAYNALDVDRTYACYECLRDELHESGQYELFEQEVMRVAPFLWGLHKRGIAVDEGAQGTLARRYRDEIQELRERVSREVGHYNERRVAPLRSEVERCEEHIRDLEGSFRATVQCEIHPDYRGIRGKRFAEDEACRCREVHAEASEVRERKGELRKRLTQARGKLKLLDKRGIDPGNNHDVRWLLYSKDALGLRVQRKDGRPTADANAIKRLLSLKDTERKGVRHILLDIKRIQHLEKYISTFLYPQVDEEGFAHPPYRMHGAGTGRPASGDDPDLGDKGHSGKEYKFNAFNIPEEVRVVFVPRVGGNDGERD